MSQPYGRKSTHNHFQRTHNHFKVISNITVTFLLFAKSKNMRFVPAFCAGMILFASLLFGVGGSDPVAQSAIDQSRRQLLYSATPWQLYWVGLCCETTVGSPGGGSHLTAVLPTQNSEEPFNFFTRQEAGGVFPSRGDSD